MDNATLTIDDELIKEFLWTTREEVGRLEVSLVELEKGNRDREAINAVYRTFHSVKGAAGLVQMPVLEHAAHSCESLLMPCRDDPSLLSGDLVSLLLQALDGIKSTLNEIESTGSESLTVFNRFVELESALTSGQAGGDFPSEASANPRPGTDAFRIKTSSNRRNPLNLRENDAAAAAVADVPPAVRNAPAIAAPPPVPPPSTIQPIAPAPVQALHAAAPPATPAHAAAAPAMTGEPASAGEPAETAVRVDITLLDKLMNQVGELVLARNRLLQVSGTSEDANLTSTAQAINQVTSALQEHVMRTRMQPIGNLFAKFPRLIRDLSRQLGKQIELDLSGKDTELDRTLLEGLRDPFTHILRNACDHGIERPEARAAAGKPVLGRLSIRAFHEGGQVIIEIIDDGKGIDPARVKAKAVAQGVITAAEAARIPDKEAVALICHPGLSTAEEVTSISGRGVGMDVVKKNIEKMGGSLEITSVIGRGSTFRLKIPLTLAIIPALMVRAGDGLYGIPQLNLVELVGLDLNENAHRIETVRGAEVYRLRERLLTLVRLDRLIGAEPATKRSDGMVFIVVVSDGDLQFGLVVDEILDTEEIVVKPLSRHLATVDWFAGATIRGDGRVALILDMAGVARHAQMQTHKDRQATTGTAVLSNEHDEFLVFSPDGHERYAVPLSLVNRIELHERTSLSTVNGMRVLVRDGHLTPAIDLDLHTSAKPLPEGESPVYAIVLDHRCGGAILAHELIDNLTIDIASVLDNRKLSGSDTVIGLAVVDSVPTAILDVHHLISHAFPHLGETPAVSKAAAAVAPPPAPDPGAPKRNTILFCEDAQFFQNTVASYLTEAGIPVDVCSDGQQGWQRLEAEPDRYGMVLTDLEMPVMDGWTLIKQIRQFPHYDTLPVVALTSLSDEAVRQRTLQLGASDYAVKLKRDQLLAIVAKHLVPGRKG